MAEEEDIVHVQDDDVFDILPVVDHILSLFGISQALSIDHWHIVDIQLMLQSLVFAMLISKHCTMLSSKALVRWTIRCGLDIQMLYLHMRVCPEYEKEFNVKMDAKSGSRPAALDPAPQRNSPHPTPKQKIYLNFELYTLDTPSTFLYPNK